MIKGVLQLCVLFFCFLLLACGVKGAPRPPLKSPKMSDGRPKAEVEKEKKKKKTMKKKIGY